MLLRSIALKTLRDQRLAVLAWGGGLGLTVLANAAAWARAYPDAAARQTLARELVSGALNQVRLLYGMPHNLDQLGGWVEWRGLGLVPVLLGLFMVIAATGETRGQELRGDLELALAAPRRRGRVFVEQALGLLLALTAACTLIWIGLLLCARAAGTGSISAGDALLAVLNVGGAAAVWGAFALLTAQFASTRRSAATAAAAVMLIAYFWNTVGLSDSSFAHVRRLSPFALYSASTPLSQGHVEAGALLGQAALALALAVAAGWLFTQRDVGAVVETPIAQLRRSVHGRRSTQLLGSVFGRALRDSLLTAVVWGLALGAFAALIVAVTPGAIEAYRNPQTQQLFSHLGRGAVGTDAQLLAFALFGILPPLAAICGITLISSWTGEEADGRLGMELACPISRPRYYAERLLAAFVTAAIVILISGACYAVAALVAGIHVDAGRSVAAFALVGPVVTVVIACGFAIASATRFSAAGLTSLAVAGSFLLALLAPLFGWSGNAQLLSVFHLYGRPLLDGVDLGGLSTLLALTAAFALAGLIAFQRKSISR